VAAVLVLLAIPVAAQAKDPFRPPPGIDTLGGSGSAPGAPAGGQGGGGSQIEPPRDDLPRTGLDYSVPVLAALGFLVGGSSLRLASFAIMR
jgi:hypothetical protein